MSQFLDLVIGEALQGGDLGQGRIPVELCGQVILLEQAGVQEFVPALVLVVIDERDAQDQVPGVFGLPVLQGADEGSNLINGPALLLGVEVVVFGNIRLSNVEGGKGENEFFYIHGRNPPCAIITIIEIYFDVAQSFLRRKGGRSSFCCRLCGLRHPSRAAVLDALPLAPWVLRALVLGGSPAPPCGALGSACRPIYGGQARRPVLDTTISSFRPPSSAAPGSGAAKRTAWRTLPGPHGAG